MTTMMTTAVINSQDQAEWDRLTDEMESLEGRLAAGYGALRSLRKPCPA
jgi:hypothetical protein